MERRGGHFIGLSSLADSVAIANAPSYAASKAGVSAYLRSMSLALRPRSIAITNVRFGFVDTKMARAAQKPLMMSRAKAAAYVLRCLDRRPMQLSVPKLAAAAVWVLGAAQTTLAAWMR
jgi:short-subunit dehydrogenase